VCGKLRCSHKVITSNVQTCHQVEVLIEDTGILNPLDPLGIDLKPV